MFLRCIAAWIVIYNESKGVVRVSEAKLKAENQKLRKENKRLKAEVKSLKKELEKFYRVTRIEENPNSRYQTAKVDSPSSFDKYASVSDKVKLFASLFKGRTDVYAEHFINSKTGKRGYAPKKLPYWERTEEKQYVPLTLKVYEEHLRGNHVMGLFPITSEDECSFLAIDLDKENWKKDVEALNEVCEQYSVPISVERSQSGNGAHIWIFFSGKVKASVARKLGTELLNTAMQIRHELSFDSFDRLFPNQDFVPKGGFGNLIALPLQKEARENGNSVFVNKEFLPFEDQWAYLSSIEKMNKEIVAELIQRLQKENEDISQNTHDNAHSSLSKLDFPDKVTLLLSNMIFIKKEGISSRALHTLKWLAAFHNPEFYQLQAMRRSTYRVQRVISCHEESSEYLGLPRGVWDDVEKLFNTYSVKLEVEDLRENSNAIVVEFNGSLRPQQEEAVARLLEHDNGVLCGTTAFGKTVAALNLIAKRKLNTLILVNKVSLAEQWQKRIDEFLTFDKNREEMVGQLGGGKKNLTSTIDVALLQSLYRKNEVHECVKNYGMIIVDECHHISAFSFESVLKQANAKAIYGLTATPKRKDGHHPIIHMQCGPIRYQDDMKAQTNKRPFDHIMKAKFTPLDPSLTKERTIQETYSKLVGNEQRNQIIIKDIIENAKEKRCALVLTERIEHIEILYKELSQKMKNVFKLSGNLTAKKNKETIEKISSLSDNHSFTIVSTGKYIGEGFDESRLDTLFLAMPISWKGRLQQYAGRLHRLHEGKSEVKIIDYADIHVPVLEKMFQKRLKGYRSMGYSIQMNDMGNSQSIFGYSEFEKKLKEDFMKAKEKIMISSPSLTVKGAKVGYNLIKEHKDNVEVMFFTKNPSEITNKNYRKSREKIIADFKKEFKVNTKNDVFQSCVIIDDSVLWYGSIQLMGYNTKENSFIRLESPALVKEFKDILNSQS